MCPGIAIKAAMTLQEDRSKLDERMMQSVKRASKDADAMLVIVDASDRPAQALTFLASTFEEAAVPLAVVLNKVCTWLSVTQCLCRESVGSCTCKEITRRPMCAT